MTITSSPTISIIIPCYNEEVNIKSTYDQIIGAVTKAGGEL